MEPLHPTPRAVSLPTPEARSGTPATPIGFNGDAALVERINDALPQTQCTRCGYPDCRAYAQAVAQCHAGINQCPPGGAEGVQRLAAITQRPVLPLSPAHGEEGPRLTVWIDEEWCIGCTLCIKACPTDAIVGASKRMHTVIEPLCTGCERCLPVCPVDCIRTEPVSGALTGWAAWSADQAQMARNRYEKRSNRLALEAREHQEKLIKKAEAKLNDLQSHSRITQPEALDTKRAIIEAALAKARMRQGQGRQHAPEPHNTPNNTPDTPPLRASGPTDR